MNFIEFQKVVIAQFETMKNHPLYRVDLSKDQLWDTYLAAFPEGSNPMFRERTVHDCQCCKQFIRLMGGVVCYHDGIRTTIWELGTTSDDPIIQEVCHAMNWLVNNEDVAIREPFMHYENKIGTPHNHGVNPEGADEEWDHFALDLPLNVVKSADQIPTLISKVASSKSVFGRALRDITMDSIDTVIELIGQKSLYRGEEHLHTLNKFRTHKIAFNAIEGEEIQDVYLWTLAAADEQGILRIRNTSIGTLLVDLSDGKTLDHAVGAFEAMVAPANYKRPTALITPTMIKKAQETCVELGFSEALQRRHAVITDIKVSNVLYVSRGSIKKLQGNDPFEALAAEAQVVDPKHLDKIEEISAEVFLKDVLPITEKLEILVENRHEGNLMSVIAPVDPDASNMLKWGNNFSWSYKGEITDSMKQRVKAAGGNVEGIIRFSIQWNAGDKHERSDYDAHCQEPGGNTIYYGSTLNSRTGGNLDVDIISPKKGVPAVENITWPQEGLMGQGTYRFLVHNYNTGTNNLGFTAELEYNGEIRSYTYAKPLRAGEKVDVATVQYKTGEMVVTKELPSNVSSKEVWGLKTMQFKEVSVLMNSPNHWDGEETGNKHLFFIMDDCKQPGEIRGFYNEFLTDKLHEHRKVFEVLGSKMKVAESDEQLSGLGFSNTQRNDVFVRVTTGFTRTLKITF
jgi:hypothetical protein